LTIKAILLDYIGTLVEPRNYSMEHSKAKLHKALCEAGLITNVKDFLEVYAEAHEKYRKMRYEQLNEVTNAIWVSEALNTIRCQVTVDDARLKSGLNVFFQDFIDSLELRPYAKKLIKKASELCKVGLVSNFTYAPAIYASLRKLGMNQFFSAIVISESVGWRKPHKTIFNEALRMLCVKREEAVFVGDSPNEDIEGARSFGMRTIFVASSFNMLVELEKSGVRPDFVAMDLEEIYRNLPEILQSLAARADTNNVQP
jgi:FMN phosphatase YigB (HAD superfamily)